MKKKQVISAVLVTAAFSIAIFIGCKKEETNTKLNPAQGSVVESPSISNARLSAGARSYYSKDGDGNVYRMDLTFNASGDATVVRSTFSTSQPDTIKTRIGFENGIAHTLYNEDAPNHKADSLRLQLAAGSKYFFIPFKPQVTPNEVIDGGFFHGYCQRTCSGSGICFLHVDVTPDVIYISCLGDCLCELVSDGCSGGGSGDTGTEISTVPFGGYMLIEANSLNVTN